LRHDAVVHQWHPFKARGSRPLFEVPPSFLSFFCFKLFLLKAFLTFYWHGPVARLAFGLEHIKASVIARFKHAFKRSLSEIAFPDMRLQCGWLRYLPLKTSNGTACA
jgi:hypothetical protein